jgi:hypothetical protein
MGGCKLADLARGRTALNPWGRKNKPLVLCIALSNSNRVPRDNDTQIALNLWKGIRQLKYLKQQNIITIIWESGLLREPLEAVRANLLEKHQRKNSVAGFCRPKRKSVLWHSKARLDHASTPVSPILFMFCSHRFNWEVEANE